MEIDGGRNGNDLRRASHSILHVSSRREDSLRAEDIHDLKNVQDLLKSVKWCVFVCGSCEPTPSSESQAESCEGCRKGRRGVVRHEKINGR